MSGIEIRSCACEGWWEQNWHGRQPMRQLMLSFEGGRIRGSGVDMVGRFIFNGAIAATGMIVMVKKYIGGHSANYVGTYDGEGTMSGEWRIGIDRGRWMINIRRAQAASEEEIAEIG